MLSTLEEIEMVTLQNITKKENCNGLILLEEAIKMKQIILK